MAEETNEKTQQELLQEEIDAYKEKLSKITDFAELDKEEEDRIKAIDEFDIYLKEVKYDLPASVTFEGRDYSRKQVAGKIAIFLAKNEVEWRYALGLYGLIQLWKGNEKEITYGALDSTLRLLDQVKYKGEEEWKNILIVNEYMKGLHEAYTKDLTQQIYLAQMHSAVLDRRELLTPVTSKEPKE